MIDSWPKALVVIILALSLIGTVAYEYTQNLLASDCIAQNGIPVYNYFRGVDACYDPAQQLVIRY